MTPVEAVELTDDLRGRVMGAVNAFRAPDDAPDDLQEFAAFYDDAEQQAVIARGRSAAAAFLETWAHFKPFTALEPQFVNVLRKPIARLSQSLAAADPTFDATPFAAVAKPAAKVVSPRVPSPGAHAAVVRLLGFLARSPEEKALLELVAAKALEVKKNGQLVFEDAVVTCRKPAKAAAGVPASYAALAKTFSSVLWERAGTSVGYLGVTSRGALANGSWEWEALEEGDNRALRTALKKAGLELRDLRCAFACGSNWILFDPTRVAKSGEPALAFVSHADCKWVPLKSADRHDAAGVLLRLMAWSLADSPCAYDEISA